MKKFTKDTEAARNNLHHKESEASDRISGFEKSRDHKDQRKRDYRKREQDVQDLIRKNLEE